MTTVKICGVNSAAAFDAAAAAGADYLGFVFFPPSPRFISPAFAAALAARHQNGPRRIGLFVAPEDAEIAEALSAVTLDALQIYAQAARCRAIKATFGLPVWRAVGVGAAADLPCDEEGLDGFIIEAKAPPEATRPGGNAAVLDWRLLRHWQAPGFWLLGGGLNPANVVTAIAQSGAPGVDVSSGVEAALGVKSPELIRRFIAAVKPPAAQHSWGH